MRRKVVRTKQLEQASAEGFLEGRRKERVRATGILKLPEATNRRELALVLICETELDVSAAAAILAKATPFFKAS